MTYTDCWISTVDDDDFKALIAEQRKLDARRAHPINLLPRLPAASHYWLPIVKE